MAKDKKLTPQELYRAKKQREEQEKTAYLPPGLINHGNTCFMNSVLQGLIATPLLSDLAHFNPVAPPAQQHCSTSLSSKKSPLLTNGHNMGGQHEQKWVDNMPIGDVFLTVMHKAWETQSLQRRESLSPKPILGALGRKYDQYLDFAQQDAHEFLRILLDAMRMEELDVIKKRQPPMPSDNPKKRRRTTITPSGISTSTLPISGSECSIPEQDKLMSLPDMIFGGKLTSILVCQKCKNVSQTYEEFNDISLSIKAEDYHERKRDRLKNLAKRLTSFPAATLAVGSEIPRSSSVPPSPRERETQQLGGHEEPIVDDPRRRSLDIVADPGQEADSERSTTSKEDIVTIGSDGTNTHVNGSAVSEDRHIEIVEAVREGKKEKKEKKDDSWAKIGRRISMTVGMGKASKEKDRTSRSRDRASRDLSRTSVNLGTPRTAVDEGRPSIDGPASVYSTPRTSTSDAARPPPSILLSRPSTPPSRPNGLEPALSPSIPSASLPQRHGASSPRFPNIQRTKSPKPPKPSAGELEYLRQILSDVTPTSSNPFSLFRPAYHHQNSSRSIHAGSTSASGQHLWLGINQFSGIEDCLRMFTAVEILDGENMVGCRRCWKIANGSYPPKDQSEDDSDSVDHDSGIAPSIDIASSRHGLSPLAPPPVIHLPTSVSTPTVAFYKHPNNIDNRSVSSLPGDVVLEPELPKPPRPLPLPPMKSYNSTPTPGGLPIPYISTTEPDNPAPASTLKSPHNRSSLPTQSARPPTVPEPRRANSVPLAQPVPRLGQVLSHIPAPATVAAAAAVPAPPTPNSVSKDSLPIPATRRHQLRSEMDSSADESSGAESEASVATSAQSLTSSSTSVGGGANARPSFVPSPLHPHDHEEHVSTNGSSGNAIARKPSRPKPVIMRPAYKRYLIAAPPPVLVIHLKRFQQTSKAAMLSFSHGFRKLDDYVSFPELLDLTPYLAPRKEDFGLGKRKAGAGKEKSGVDGEKGGKGKEKEKCVYRLYAVVVHIGNMLGGHYIAYTALPSASRQIPSSASLRTPTMSAMSTPAAAPPGEEGSGSGAGGEQGRPAETCAKREERQWAYISDTIVRLTTLEEVMKAKAYMCMYERV